MPKKHHTNRYSYSTATILLYPGPAAALKSLDISFGEVKECSSLIACPLLEVT